MLEYKEYINDLKKYGSKPGLDRIRRLLQVMGNPQDDIKTIHIAGTNGKGSIASMLNSVLLNTGYTTGLFISPYLINFNEMIIVNGEIINDGDLDEIITIIQKSISNILEEGFDHPTEYEVATAAAFLYFSKSKVDYAIIEVGMGGRLDATNIITPILSIISPISMDHTRFLGDTLEKITIEKCGIIKSKVPVVISPQNKTVDTIIEKSCSEREATLFKALDNQVNIKFNSFEKSIFDFDYMDSFLGDIEINLPGRFQITNALTALTSLVILKKIGLKIAKESIYKGLSQCSWPCRMEMIRTNPSIIIDGAHNESGILEIINIINQYFKHKKINMIIGLLEDKEVYNALNEACVYAQKLIITKPENKRALDPAELAKKLRLSDDKIIIEKDIEKSVNIGLDITNKDDLLIIFGSLYMVGVARDIIINK